MRDPKHNNVFNPEGIEEGDIVRLRNQDDDRFPKGNMVVITVRGRNGNKIWCREMFTELYAQCFMLVLKGEDRMIPVAKKLAALAAPQAKRDVLRDKRQHRRQSK